MKAPEENGRLPGSAAARIPIALEVRYAAVQPDERNAEIGP